MSSHQRRLANLRERKRMMLINTGFDLLKSKLPLELLTKKTFKRDGSIYRSNNHLRGCRKFRLTKVDILRLTINYIRQLDEMRLSAGDDHTNTSDTILWTSSEKLDTSNEPYKTIAETFERDRSMKQQIVQKSSQSERKRRDRKGKLDSQMVSSEARKSQLDLTKRNALFHWKTKRYYLSCSTSRRSENHQRSKEILWVPPG